jgi:NAD(P)H-dependent FMN reductase
MTAGSDPGRRFLFVVGSARIGGSSEMLARHAAAALPQVTQDWKRLSDLPLAAFPETPAGAYPAPLGSERVLLDATLHATDLVVVSPLYWYSVSASVKLYLDYWGGWLHRPAIGFRPRMRGKTMWVVTSFGGNDPTSAEPLLEALRRSADYLGMRWGGAVVGHGDGRSPAGSADPEAVVRARLLFEAEFTGWPHRATARLESDVEEGTRR